MKSFISSELNVSLENAYVIQKKYFLKYGTTLRGLMMNHNVKPTYFLKYVHDINLKPIKKNLTLKEEMKKFSGRKIIFTNGTTEHATNVLKKVGVFEEIDSIFDIEDADYIPKPALLPYKKIVNKYFWNCLFKSILYLNSNWNFFLTICTVNYNFRISIS